MLKLAMSPAASALLRALIARAAVDRNRILLTELHSTDWQSLTFTGERHEMTLRITGKDSEEGARRMCTGLSETEFTIAGAIVADVGAVGPPRRAADGATEVSIEALTIESD